MPPIIARTAQEDAMRKALAAWLRQQLDQSVVDDTGPGGQPRPTVERVKQAVLRGAATVVNKGLGALGVREAPASADELAGNLMGTVGPLAAPAAVTMAGSLRQWKPTSRGVFPRDVPDIQGTVAPNPKLENIFAQKKAQQKGKMGERVSNLVRLVADSPFVQKGLVADAEKGVRRGGGQWYNVNPIRTVTPDDVYTRWNTAGAAASAQSSVNNELVTNAILQTAVREGIPLRDALDIFMQQVYKLPAGEWTRLTAAKAAGNARAIKAIKNLQAQGVAAPFLSGFEDAAGRIKAGTHMDNAQRGLAAGLILPVDYTTGAWKLPSYEAHRLGVGGLDPLQFGVFPALDTHEKTRLYQLALNPKNPDSRAVQQELRRLYKNKSLVYTEKGTGGIVPKIRGKKRATGTYEMILPDLTATNDEYRTLGNLYISGAKKLGLPTAGAFQAGRWIGGGLETGLKSAPFGDLTQIIEDMLLYSAQRRNMSTSPRALQKYWQNVSEGKDYLVPFTGSGAPPVY